MRVGEVTGLQWDNLDFDNGLIGVNMTLVYYSKGKGLNYSMLLIYWRQNQVREVFL